MKRMCTLLLLTATACAGSSPQPPAPVPVPPLGEPEITAPVPALRPVTHVTSIPEPEPVAPPVILASTTGEATYYADKFDGRRTASGIVFRNREMYAAHRTYPFGTVVLVTNLANDSSVVLTVVDRGPHGTSARARRTIIDVSRSAAEQLDFVRAGRVPVRVDVLEWGR